MDKIIPFNKGIRRQPSFGEDGELSELVNLIPKNGELVNIKAEVGAKIPTLKAGCTFACTHHANGEDLYISYNGSVLYYQKKGQSTWNSLNFTSNILNITPIGNVLVVACEDTVSYALFKEGVYQYLSGDFPDLSIKFGLYAYEIGTGEKQLTYSTGSTNSEISQLVYNAIKADLDSAKKDYFVSPFFVRYAYRMYDGSLIYHSSPIFMPCCTEDEGLWVVTNTVVSNDSATTTGHTVALKHKLAYNIPNVSLIDELKEYRDLIRSVDIFVSNPITMLGEASDWVTRMNADSLPIDQTLYKSYSISKIESSGRFERQLLRNHLPSSYQIKSITSFRADSEKVKKSIEDCSNFYLLKSFKLEELSVGNKMVEIEVDKSYLLSLANREAMDDDFNTRSAKSAIGSFSYNNRVHLYGVRDFLTKEFPIDSMYVYANTGELKTMSLHVHTKIGASNVVVKINAPNATIWTDTELMYIYYPDPNASKVTIGIGGDYYDIPLTKHNFLYGSYAFAEFSNMFSSPYTAPPVATTDTGTWRKNYMLYSLPDNPFMFPATNVVAVGDGEILKLSTAAKALSEGQYGQFPLYVFSTDGIFALSVNNDGSYIKSDPLSRDVCNNPDSITQIDGAVVFTTDQGLKMVQGSDVVLLSGHMDGHNVKESDYFKDGYFAGKDANKYGDFDGLVKEEDRDFREILRNCRIAYDYPNNMLRIYPKVNNDKYYVFDLGTREFSSCIGGDVDAVIADYPTSIIQKGQELFTFKNSIDEGHKKGLLLTRPISLDNPSALKKLQELKIHYSKLNDDTYCKVVMFASFDGKKWVEVASLRGSSYKYFRFGVITHMTNDEALSGMVVRYELNRTNKLR